MPNLVAKARTYFFGSGKSQHPKIAAPLAPLKQYAAEQGVQLLSLKEVLKYVLIDHPTERVCALLAAYAVKVDLAKLKPLHNERKSKTCPGVSKDVEAIIQWCVRRAQDMGASADTFDSTDLLIAMTRHRPSAARLRPLGLSAQKVTYFLSHGVPLPANINDEMGLDPSEDPVWIRIENDPYTPAEVLLIILQDMLQLEPQAALQLTYQIHLHGCAATVGPYAYPKARKHLLQMRGMIRDLAQPLRVMLSHEPVVSPQVQPEAIPPAAVAIAHASWRTKRKLLAPHWRWRFEPSLEATFWLALSSSLLTLYAGDFFFRSLHLHAPAPGYAWLIIAILGTGGFFSLSLWAGLCRILCWHFNFRPPRAAALALQVGSAVLISLALLQHIDTLGILIDAIRGRQRTPEFTITLQNEHTLNFKGGFSAGTTIALEAALERYPDVSMIRLEGPGGLATEGFLMGRAIRAHHLQTRVDGSCASACTLAYLGGSRRYLGTGGRLLFHRIWSADGVASAVVNFVLSHYMKQRGLSNAFVERAKATPASTLWQPTIAELLDNGVVDEIRSNSSPTTFAARLTPAGLRKELAPYATIVQKNKLPQIVIIAKKGNVTGVTSSRFRGQPYWPRNLPYPRDPTGVPMVMLVQLNFSEMPPLPDYPKTGILQFFISSSEGKGHFLGMSGRAFDDDSPRAQFAALQKPEYFRVIYHPVIEDSNNLVLTVPTPGPAEMPIYDTASLAFTQRDSYVSAGDYRFERLFGASEPLLKKALGADFKPIEAYWDSLQSRALATVGGYSHTEQGFDPRSAVADEDWLVLLSVDADASTDVGVSWGDGGVGNWWIERRALERLDFSHVAYYWDTG